ncbi:MAG: ferritin-like domain-containing protein [Bacteroidetes bacterium]|nr:ferritin-like domain-containing protein [Bacteroidota bacterium]
MKEPMKQSDEATGSPSGVSRRKFLTYAGAIAGAGVIIASCHKKDDNVVAVQADIDLGSADQGLLNYAYLLQQLEAAFYETVVKYPYPGMTATEVGFFTNMRDHEYAHREFLKNYLTPTKAIPMVEVDFSSIDFNLKSSVMAKAKFFEETVTNALNGICKLLTFSDSLVLVTKMASVDARHSAIINDFITPGTFAESTDSNGMDATQDPQSSLDIVRKFFKRTISGIYLPKY